MINLILNSASLQIRDDHYFCRISLWKSRPKSGSKSSRYLVTFQWWRTNEVQGRFVKKSVNDLQDKSI